MKRLSWITAALFCVVAVSAEPTVTNVRTSQRVDSKLVDVWYDISNVSAGSSATASTAVEVDGVLVVATNFTGDVGSVTNGANKHIVWNAGTDWNGRLSSSARIKVTVQTIAPTNMVLIPAGTNSGTDPEFGGYSLTVDAFFMDKYEVTKAKWAEVYTWAVANGYVFDNAGTGKASSHPVHTVSWYDCLKWCNARSQKDGRTPCYTVGGTTYKTGQSSPDCSYSANGYRLPTNTEWGYASRGGVSGKRFPWGNTITHSQANYNSTSSFIYDVSPTRGHHPTYATGSYPYTSPVGSFAANGYGLYDMAGNVCEWCWDVAGSGRCIRGGSWYDNAYFACCGDTSCYGLKGVGDYRTGFRAICR